MQEGRGIERLKKIRNGFVFRIMLLQGTCFENIQFVSGTLNKDINYIDVLVLTETKIDDSFPTAQFLVRGFSKPYRLDRNSNGGGVMIYVREDIPSKKLEKHNFSHDVEGILVELNFKKCKWLLFGTYHPPS